MYEGGLRVSLQAKKYTLWDTVVIPTKITPVYSGIMILNNIMMGFIPAIQVTVLASFIDTAIAIFQDQAKYEEIFVTLLGLLGIVAYTNVQQTIMGLIQSKFSMRLTEKYHLQIVERRAKLKYEHIENNEVWDLMNRVCGNDVGKLEEGFFLVQNIISKIIYITSIILMIAQVMWLGAVMIVVIAIPLLKLSIKAGKEHYEADQEVSKHQRKLDYLNGILTSRDQAEERTLFGYTDALSRRWYEAFESARVIILKVQAKNFITMKLSSIVTVFISMFIVSILLFPLNKGTITIGFFMSLIMAAFNLVDMMSWELSYMMKTFAHYKEYLKELSEFSQLSEVEGALESPMTHKDLRLESLEFRNVTFKYPKTERHVLKNFSLKIDGKKRYAIVGANGAGKTTLTKLLVRLYDNYEGEIFINGKDLRTYKYEELKSMFAIVHQDFAKYEISVKDNLYIGTDQLDVRKGEYEALEQLGLLEYLEQLPKGMDTYLGKIKSGGTDLSGGQWQKLAIARAIIRKAPITILDEPTAALDPVAESTVYKLFNEMSKGHSTISITHRLGASKQADAIIVINDGMVAEQGTHQELIQLGGIYAKMFQSQRSWYE